MARSLQFRRGTTTQHSTFTGASGEVTVDTDKKTIVVHDGTTAGGSPVITEAGVRTGVGNLHSPLLEMPLRNSLSIDKGTGYATFTNSSSVRTYIDKYGVLKYAYADEPRFEAEGYLNEGASTNLLTYSTDFSTGLTFGNTLRSAGGWSPTSAGNEGAIIALDPTKTGNAGCGQKNCSQTYAIGDTVSISVHVKYISAHLRIDIPSALLNTYGVAAFDLINGTVGQVVGSGGINAKIKPVAGGGYRCTVSATVEKAVTTPTEYITFAISNPASVSSIIQADGVSSTQLVAIYGGQVEKLPFATSYIPTTNATVTRNADKLSISAAGNYGLASSAKTIIMDWDILGHSTTFQQYLFDLTSSAQYNRVVSSLHTTSNRAGIFYSGGFAYVNVSAQPANTPIRTAFTISGGATSTIGRYADGVLYASSSATITADGAPSTLYIGQGNLGTLQHFGHIKNLRIYDKALNAQEVSLA